MPRLEYTIGPKREGNYRIPVDMKITFTDEDGLHLNPSLVLRKLYKLSDWGFSLALGPEDSRVIYVDSSGCKSINCFAIEWPGRSVPKNKNEWVIDFHSLLCGRPALKCADCKIYAGWDTFSKDIYSAIENFIIKISTDIVTAWEEAILRAKEVIPLEEKKVTVELPLQNASILNSYKQDENKPTISRKIKLS